jgi:hypothetical protein
MPNNPAAATPPDAFGVYREFAILTAELTVRRVAEELIQPLREELNRVLVEVRVFSTQMQRLSELEDKVRLVHDCKEIHSRLEAVLRKSEGETGRTRSFRDRLHGAWATLGILGALIGGAAGVISLFLRLHGK